MSPRRGKGSSDFVPRVDGSPGKSLVDRSQAATPPIKNVYILDEGFSGYEGDYEDDFEGKKPIIVFLFESAVDGDKEIIYKSCPMSVQPSCLDNIFS